VSQTRRGLWSGDLNGGRVPIPNEKGSRQSSVFSLEGSALGINAGKGERGLLWQARFFDRALRSVKEYYEKVEYIHLNPARAGLAERAEEWQWSSVHDYTAGLMATFGPNRALASDRVPLPADEWGRI